MPSPDLVACEASSGVALALPLGRDALWSTCLHNRGLSVALVGIVLKEVRIEDLLLLRLEQSLGRDGVGVTLELRGALLLRKAFFIDSDLTIHSSN